MLEEHDYFCCLEREITPIEMSYDPKLQRRSTPKDQAVRADESGAQVCVKDIFQAAIEGDVECIQANIDLGVPVNKMGKPDHIWGPRFEKSGLFIAAPLHYACSYGREEAVKLLLENGARVDQRSASGLTPKDYARRRNYTQLLALMQ
jgi:ankyrin repeat protein